MTLRIIAVGNIPLSISPFRDRSNITEVRDLSKREQVGKSPIDFG
jgi:hypothetical protein